MRRRLALVAAVVVLALSSAGCVQWVIAHSPPPAPSFSYDDSRRAVDENFADLGPVVLAKAHCIVQRESGYNPNATNGQYRGIFQLGSNYDGTISVTNDGNVFNPYTNAMVARIAYLASGWRPWSTAPGC